ncbi:MAG: hypothetical protein V3U80_05470, partial [Flavobacteriaceae bacterium]
MKNIFLFLILTTTFNYAQVNDLNDFGCGTIHLKDKKSNLTTQKNNNTIKTMIDIPVKFHIVRNSNGTGGISESNINNELVILNNFYNTFNINFFMCESVNY